MMVQPWALGMDTSGSAEQQRHDELLRMRCLELTFAECFEQGTVQAARHLYHAVTGRKWPEWPINRKGTISCEPT